MTDFVAIAIRTINHKPTSICHIALAVVQQSQIVLRMEENIVPVHDGPYGCTPPHHNALTFPKAWAHMAPVIGNLPLVAHNSLLCESCLRAIFEFYLIPYPEFQFHCTYTAAKEKTFSPALPNYRLNTVAEHCGLHPDAMPEVDCIAHVAMQIL